MGNRQEFTDKLIEVYSNKTAFNIPNGVMNTESTQQRIHARPRNRSINVVRKHEKKEMRDYYNQHTKRERQYTDDILLRRVDQDLMYADVRLSCIDVDMDRQMRSMPSE